MKFVSNHKFRFSSPGIAFITGLLLTLMVVCCELVNFLVLICSRDTLEIVINFMGLVVIAEFEEFLSASLQNDRIKRMLENDYCKDILLVITRTSSRNARKEVEHNEIQDLNLTKEQQKAFGLKIPSYIGIHWRNRSIDEKLMYAIYKVCRVIYVAIWFYYLPFIFVYVLYYLPWYLKYISK